MLTIVTFITNVHMDETHMWQFEVCMREVRSGYVSRHQPRYLQTLSYIYIYYIYVICQKVKHLNYVCGL